MHGPTAGADPLGRAPSPVIAATVASMTPRERAAPAAMRRADHPGLGIDEQHRRAIRRQNAERDPRHAAHHAVGARVLRRPTARSTVIVVGAVHLVAADQPVGRKARVATAAIFPVALDPVVFVAGAETAIERGVHGPR